MLYLCVIRNEVITIKKDTIMKAILKCTGEEVEIIKVVKAQDYKCYFVRFADGKESDGYFIESDLVIL